jgi:hypothetical protein
MLPMGLSSHEKENLGFLIGGGVLLAISSIGFRFLVDRRLFGFPEFVFRFQYSIVFLFLGVLLVSLWQANSQVGNYAYAVLSMALGIALLLPPPFITRTDLLMNAFYLGLVVGGGFLHYRFNSPSNTLFIWILAVFGHEVYLFGFAYCVAGFLALGQLYFPVAVLLLSAILYGYRNILVAELEKTQDDSLGARSLAVFLNPM